MSPGKYNMPSYQGATFTKSMVWEDENGLPVNLTGWTADMHVRVQKGATQTVLEFSTTNDTITLGGIAGTIDLFQSDEVMNDVPAKTYVYDLVMISPSGQESRLLEGSFYVFAGVTR